MTLPSTPLTLLRCSLALFIISPLINVGPVNIGAFLLLLSSLLWLSINPGRWWGFWREHLQLLLLMSVLLAIFFMANQLNALDTPMEATFAQGRWLILLTLAAPAIARGVDVDAWKKILQFAVISVLFAVTTYCLDAALYLGWDSNLVLNLLDAQRSDPLRPSWVFNPHPFSRTLIAALLLLIGALTLTENRRVKQACLLGTLGLGVMLLLGAVRTALLSLAVIAAYAWIAQGRGRALVGLLAGLLLGVVSLWVRAFIFPQQDPDRSLQFRIALFEQGMQAFQEKPWLGGGYQAARRILWPENLQAFMASQTLATSNTHVQWLEMLVSYGVIGGGLFLAVWAASGWLVVQAQRQATRPLRLAALLLLLNWISLTVAGFTTVFRESEWALWIVTLLAASWLLEQRGLSSAAGSDR